MKRLLFLLIIVLGVFFPVSYVLWPLPQSRDSGSTLDTSRQNSLRITDRYGNLLREVLSSKETTSQPIQLSEVPKYLTEATIATEDKNFYQHLGIDFPATFRALWQNLRALKVVSGASTISQQTARLLLDLGNNRDPATKLWIILHAVRLEMHLTKHEILTEYLNHAPYGNQTYGLAAASQCYFSKPPSNLTLAEAALLAGLPQSPSALDPFRYFDRAKKKQKEVLRRMLQSGFITDREFEDALVQPIDLSREKRNFQAPHFVDFVLEKRSTPSSNLNTRIVTTLDLPLQQECEMIVRQHIEKLKRRTVTNAAVVIMENETGEILSMIGSADYFSQDIDGAYNGTTAYRQAGSTMKPFTYAIALERNLTPSTILADIPLPFQTKVKENTEEVSNSAIFIPQNYDKKYHGPVRLRQALACSYNIPAVKALEAVGVDNLLTRLKRLGITGLTKDVKHYGYGLTLGNAEVRLLDMVCAYSVFVRNGRFLPEKIILSKASESSNEVNSPPNSASDQPVFTQDVCALICDILSDNNARLPAFGSNSPLRFPFAVACKTGTTKDFRDNWTFGVTEDFTVGVWVGNFDGKPMQHISGIDGAAPIMHDIVMALSKRFPDRVGFLKSSFDLSPGIQSARICPVSGLLAGPNCPTSIEEKFLSGVLPSHECNWHKCLAINKQNGLLATDSTPLAYIEYRPFEDYPPQFRQWA
ncbi:MAG: penicillin-binding protein 1C, partial [Chlorobiales bacterium]|nr:penicillin-binding protein 1C [Chlorobiales bacterium]